MLERNVSFRKGICRLLPVFLLALFLLPANAFAASRSQLDGIPKTQKYFLTKPVTYYGISGDVGGVIIEDSLKTTGKAVAKIDCSYSEDSDIYFINVEPKKPGKASCSFKYKYKGKTKKYTFNFNIKKYVCPIASFKIGNYNFTNTFKTNFNAFVDKEISGKLSVKPKKGWKIVVMGVGNANRQKTVKNGARVKLVKNGTVNAVLRKGEQAVSVEVHFF